MFTVYPTYSVYRSLRLTNPPMRGEDVYALQSALIACGLTVGPLDGVLGQQTSSAIRQAQVRFNLAAVDGVAGGRTQEALALFALRAPAAHHGVPTSGMRGQIEHESSFRLGNYSPLRADGSYDAGVAQRNTAHTPVVEGFNVVDALYALAQNTRKYYNAFEGLSLRRRWALAQGAWNAPAFACYIAREEGAKLVTISMTKQPSPLSRELLEAYIADVSVYLTV